MRPETTIAPRLLTGQPARHPSPTVKASSLAYLIFERPDLKKTARYLEDFGLHASQCDGDILYLRGTGTAPYCYRVHRAEKPRFIGFGLTLNSLDDLHKIARLPGASGIEPAQGPGGGQRVRLTDPSRFYVEAVYGQPPADEWPHRPALTVNQPHRTPRVNNTQRTPAAPPEVIRLGHVVLEVADYQATYTWYTKHFGLIPSDVQVFADGSPAVAFLRLDLGDTPADHHTLALVQGIMPAYSHSAYEVVDADAVGMGQRVLRERGWVHAWGIGRHILGSQIFDYWQDPWGDKHEHYCDGDLFTADQPTGLHSISAQAMAQWGQRMPKSFTRPRMSLEVIRAVFHHLRHSPDLTLRKLITLARLFG